MLDFVFSFSLLFPFLHVDFNDSSSLLVHIYSNDIIFYLGSIKTSWYLGNLVTLGYQRWPKPNRGINSGEALATHGTADAGLTSPDASLASTFQSFSLTQPYHFF